MKAILKFFFAAALAAPVLADSTLAPFTPESDLLGSWSFQPNPSLPNVLIIGDSISIAYTRPVRAMLQQKANIHRPMQPDGKRPINCGETRMGLANLDKWLGDTKWDVIHFNWGLWDLCYRHSDSKVQGKRDKVNGTLSVPPDDYADNLEKLVQRLKDTGAKLVWASSSVIPEGEAGRFVGDEAKYNRIAKIIMQKHGIALDDIYTLTKNFEGKYSKAPGDSHFTPEGSDRIAQQVAVSILSALDPP